MKKILFFGLALFLTLSNQSVFSDDSGVQNNDAKVIVYYFHTNARCSNCINFEKYTNETIEKNFYDDISSGKIEYKVINIEEPQNKHFVQDYQLYTKSVVLSKMRNGKEVEYKNLEKIWQYVLSKNKFCDYIKQETEKFLNTDKDRENQ